MSQDFANVARAVKSFFTPESEVKKSALDRALEKRNNAGPGQVMELEADEMAALHAHDLAQLQQNGQASEVRTEVVKEPTSTVEATLNERGKRYGTFTANSIVYTKLMEVFEASPNWKDAPPAVKHACGNIATKFARLLTGDVMYYDNWRDIAGYATLMDKICNGEEG